MRFFSVARTTSVSYVVIRQIIAEYEFHDHVLITNYIFTTERQLSQNTCNQTKITINGTDCSQKSRWLLEIESWRDATTWNRVANTRDWISDGKRVD